LIGSEVHIENASKFFGEFQALKNVSLTIKKGEFFSLLGPSGCGKTTLLRIIAGFEEPSAGMVYLDGKNVIPLPANQRHVNTVFQSYALFPHLSVFENVAFPLRLKKRKESEITSKVKDYLQLVQLFGQENKKPNQLSGGQKQRVAIARALINEPSVLLLDEPLSALDAKLRQQLLVDLDTLHDKIGITFIYVTHDQGEALSVSDRVAVMHNGNVLQIGAPHEIYESPADSFVAEFIGETNTMEGVITRVDGNMFTVETPSIGSVMVTSDSPYAVGDRIRHTIRPEKVRIQKEKPEVSEKDDNVFSGKVYERIYSGFQSKFFVELGAFKFKVYKQHVNFMDMGPQIRWDDDVFLSWDADDGYIVERVPT